MPVLGNEFMSSVMKKHDTKQHIPDHSTDECTRQLEEAGKKAEEWKNKYLRALADYQNLERRTAQLSLEKEKQASEQIIRELLVVLDTFEMAQAHLNDEGLKIGVEGFKAVLKQHNVKTIEVLHKTFDPNVMECLEVVGGEKDDEVMEEVRPGYAVGEKILRPALVKVSKKQSL